MFSPVWSTTIHEEWIKSRRAKFGDPLSRLEHARLQMEQAFPGANFDPDPTALNTVSLPDTNDVHVVATAIAAQAQAIITYNHAHFPDRILSPMGLRVETPDAFVSRLFPTNRTEILEGARLHRASLKRPAYSGQAYVQHLASQELARAADLLRDFEHLI